MFSCPDLDDVANYIPARLTAFLMVVASGRFSVAAFCRVNMAAGTPSPNSGYPEAALAGILELPLRQDLTNYFGEEVWKPYIGDNERPLTTGDMKSCHTHQPLCGVANDNHSCCDRHLYVQSFP